MSDNYAEETQPLFKLLRTEAFRFVIVRYNHYSFVEQLEKDLKRLFPNRPIKKVDAQKLDYTRITNAYFSLKKGFFFIKNFDDVLKEERDSLNVETPQYAAQNERRRHITAGLNLRRDKLAKFPIALFVFVPASTGELYAKIIMEKMPDLWSFRSIILDLEKDINITVKPNIVVEGEIERLFKIRDEITPFNPKQPTELNRLLSLLKKTQKNEIAYRLTLYPQITDASIDSGDYESALSILDEWEDNTNESDKGLIWLKKGDVFTTIGKLEESLKHFEKALTFFENKEDKANIAVCLERLGNTYTTLGNLDKALTFYEERNRIGKELYVANPNNVVFKLGLGWSNQFLGNTHTSFGNLDKAIGFYGEMNHLFEELYAANPNNVDFKNGLAISYSKLGSTHTALGNLDKALSFYIEYNRLEKELYVAYPNNVPFKHGLVISYLKLGDTHTTLGNLDKALVFYEDSTKLMKELYAAYHNNVEFKNSLAASYSRLGDMHTALGNLDKALGFCEDEIVLFEELYSANPNNVEFKNGLAISYSKLGETHTALGNLDKALSFYIEYNRLEKELYDEYPTNVEFKNNLAESFFDLGKFNKDKFLEKAKAKDYFKQAESLWIELVRDAPQFVEYQKFLRIVQKVLTDL